MMDKNKLTNISVLVIDDSDLTRDLIKMMLSSFGVKEIFEARDGSSAFEMLAHRKVDIILCDIFMAPMHGHRFVEMVRAGEYPPNLNGPVACDTPIIMITGKTMKNIVANTDAPWNAILDKPINPNALLSELLRLCP